jgi:hypothetical protein
MESHKSCALLLIMLAVVLVAPAWAADGSATSEGTPAILASLDAGNVKVLDDQAAKAIRGQDYQYVLVRTLLNPLDFSLLPAVQWTGNILGYRYGAWGGPGWTNGGGTGGNTPADAMDALFRAHDSTLDNAALIFGLQHLPTVPSLFWGQVYAGADVYAPSGLPVGIGANVWVSGLSLVGGRVFVGWRPMPFTEYSRREALTGMQLLGLIP